MHLDLNPYAPGSGLKPRVLEGRHRELEAMDTTIARARHHLHSRAMVLSGLRGVGKTVLLNTLRGQADSQGWLTVPLEARSTDSGTEAVRAKLGRGLLTAARRAKGGSRSDRLLAALRSVGSFSATLGVAGVSLGIDRQDGRADSGLIEIDLEEMVADVAGALAPEGSGLAFFIDEMQDLDRDLLVALLAAQHMAGQENLPFYVFGAGLPNLPSVLADARSYAERLFDYRTVGALSDEAASAALSEPARQMGADFDPEALRILVEASGGYPYFLQEFGKAVWDVAPTTPFSTADALAAIETGTDQLDQGFFPARWDRATPTERSYLVAMAVDDDQGSLSSDISRRLDRKNTSLGPVRAELIRKGLVYSPEHGRIAYTVPGMASFIRRQKNL